MSGIGQKNIGWLTIFIRKNPCKTKPRSTEGGWCRAPADAIVRTPGWSGGDVQKVLSWCFLVQLVFVYVWWGFWGFQMVPDASASELFPDVSEWHQVSTAIFLERIWTVPFFGADFEDHQTIYRILSGARRRTAQEACRGTGKDPRWSKIIQVESVEY